LVPNTIATIFGIPGLEFSWSWIVPILLISTIISAVVTYRWTKQFRVNPFSRKKFQNLRKRFSSK